MNRVFGAILAAPVGLELAPSGEEKTLLHAVTREKRGTKGTKRARVEQREVRGAFCFPFLARARADCIGGGAPACTGRAPGLGTRGTAELLLGTTKTVAWRDKVRFLAVAEKHVVRGLLCNQ